MRTFILCSLLGASIARADVPVQHYAAGQLPPVREITPTELFRVGGYEDDLLLGVISAVSVDADGNVYLLDRQLSEVQVFDSEGNHLRTIGREGEGPGEFRNAGGLFWVDGNLCVVQNFPPRLVMFTSDGDPAGDLKMGETQGMGGFQSVQVQGSSRVFARSSGRRTDDGFAMVTTLASCDPTGKVVAELRSSETKINMAAGSIHENDTIGLANNWVLLPDGTVVLGAELDAYRLDFFGVDGSERGVTTVEYSLLSRTDKEKESARSRPRFMGRGRGRRGGGGDGPDFVVRDLHPALVELRLGPDANAWVLSARGAHPSQSGVIAQYDVYSAKGDLVDRVAIRAEGSVPQDAVFFGPGRMIVVRGFDDAQRTLFGGAASDSADEELEVDPIEIIVYAVSV